MATGGRNGTPHIDTGFSICQDIQEDFRKKAWNKSGANLLAVTCYYAQSKHLYARPQLSANDFSIAASVAIVSGVIVAVGIYCIACLTTGGISDEPTDSNQEQHVGLSSDTWYVMLTASVIGCICGALFILRRLSDWRPVESIIRTSMPKHLQQEFVNELVNVCVEEQIDPEDLESLIRFAQLEDSSTNNNNNHLSLVIMAFFRTRLKMQE